MTKKETEVQTRLLDVLEANTQALTAILELLLKLSNPPIIIGGDSANLDIKPGEIMTGPKEEKQETTLKTDITVEYCRKALKAISTKLSNAEAKTFLAQFGDAKTIPQLDEKYYEDFIAQATKIMEGE